MLNAKEKFQSYLQLTAVNGIPWLTSMNCHTHSALIDYEAVAISIMNRKTNPRMFIYNNRVASKPEINLTKFGSSLAPLIRDLSSNPYFKMKQQFNISLHPQVERFVSSLNNSIQEYRLYNPCDHKHIAAVMDSCMTNFKIHSQIRSNKASDRSWEAKYNSLKKKYKQFFQSIMRETEAFEIHTLCIEVEQISDVLYKQAYGFADKDCPTLIDDICRSIINPIWKSRKQLNLLGVLSKWVIQANGTLAKKLFFFTKVGSQTTEGNHFPHICQALLPFVQNTLKGRVFFDYHILSNTNSMMHFQGLPSNLYDYNQIDINDRLDLVNAYLIGTDYWLRINGNNPTLKIERSLY